MSAQLDQLTSQTANDPDAIETKEWLDALEAVIEHEGPERAHYLMERLVDLARRRGAHIPFSSNTAYVNTIPAHLNQNSPGNLEYEERLRSWMRWNAMAMVVKANRADGDLGGHISVVRLAGQHAGHRLQPLLARADRRPRRRPAVHPGPLVARHLRPRLPRRPPDRRPAAELPPRSRRQGPVVVPAPETDAGLLAVPDRVDGPGPADGDLPGALPEVPARARHRRHRQPQGLGLLRRRRDGRAGIDGRDRHGRARAARQPGHGRQLQPAAPGRSGARQRQDHPGTGSRLPRRRLERRQGHLGLAAGIRCWPRTRTASCSA